MSHKNQLGQLLGDPVPGWQECRVPPGTPLQGRFCRLEAIDPAKHVEQLFEANSADRENRNWTYLPYGPFDTLPDYRAWVETACTSPDPMFCAIIDEQTQRAVGVASYLRISPTQGCIEVGHINYSPLLQQKPAATEAMYLMMKRVFDLGYRRYEWKCDALNEKSCAAARRLGFSYEGTFRQAVVYKGRNRDTAWFSVIDSEWPSLRAAFERWLDPSNFDETGNQKTRLADFREPQR